MKKGVRSYKTFEEGEDAEIYVLKYLDQTTFSTTVYILCCILTAGVYYIISRWFLTLQLLKYSDSTSHKASHILVSSILGDKSILRLRRVTVPESALGQHNSTQIVSLIVLLIQVFTYRFMPYILKPGYNEFSALRYSIKAPCNEIHDRSGNGISDPVDVEHRQTLYGPCLIDVPMPSITKLLVNEVIHPFFIFQIFSVVLWMYEEYVLYALTILILSLISLMVTLVETRKNIARVRELALYECRVNVKRGEQLIEASSKELVPGDIIEIPENIALPCDLILMSGSCLMDESMLTGESQPIFKDKLPYNTLTFNRDSKYLLGAGTKPLQCRHPTLGLVLATGFATAKGELVRSILFPRPNRFTFKSDSFKFVGVLGLIAIAGFLWCLPTFLMSDMSVEVIILSSLDLITITVPPALPLAMTMGIAFAIARLTNEGVSCISPPSVNAAGRVSVITFDKTGTLTEDSMRLKGAWDKSSGIFQETLTNLSDKFQLCLATCHSLTRLHGGLVGDPQETAVFEKLEWEYLEDDHSRSVYKDDLHINILHLYHFSPVLKRMGVIIQSPYGYSLEVKGAAEEVLNLCTDTTPRIKELVHHYARQGYRILVCARKTLKEYNPTLSLQEIERDLELLGLILLQNQLKSSTKPTLEVLNQANIRCMMSTGDALLTALSVAKECSMIGTQKVYIGDLHNGELKWEDEEGQRADWVGDSSDYVFAVSGRALEWMHSNGVPALRNVLERGVVFGRMSPAHKILLIELLQVGDTMVAMCGDGANDCGALRAADVGLSLSTAEASIAAPFTGPDLKCMIDLLREGRAALVTSFQCFKFIALYSMIQFICVNMLYLMNTNLTDIQFLYADLITIVPLALFMAYTGAYKILAPELPPGSLISVHVLSSIIGQIIIQAGVSVSAYLLLIEQDWYEAQDGTVEEVEPNAENTTLYLVSNIQYIYVCMAFSIGPPFRQPAYYNHWFTFTVVFLIALDVYLIFNPFSEVRELLDLVYLNFGYRAGLFFIVFMGGLFTFIYEKKIVIWLDKKWGSSII